VVTVNLSTFLSELRRLDVRIWLEDGQLRCNARQGVMTPELRARLSTFKHDICEYLGSAQELAARSRAIVPLQQNGRHTPIFGVPGHNGDVFCYRALSQALGDDQPFFGLQPPGVDGRDTPLTSVPALADYFSTQLRGFQPEGPYVVAGFCAGGAVAFELAQRLMRDGAAVSFVALFGCQYPSFFSAASQLRYQLAQRSAGIAGHLRSLAAKSWSECAEHLAQALDRRRSRRAAKDAVVRDPVLALRATIEQTTAAAVARYRPVRFAGRLCLFLPSKAWLHSGVGALRWRSLAPHGEDYVGPEGCDGDNMLRAPNAPAFAELLRTCRDRPR